MARKPSRQQWADFHAVNAPPGFDMNKLPESQRQAPRKSSGKKRGSPETDLQIECVAWLAENYPALLVWATPNHLLYRHKPTGGELAFMARQKRAGLCKGACDLNILGRNLHGATTLLLAELKIGYAKPDEDQEKFMDSANGLGAFIGVVRSLADMQTLLWRAFYE